MIASRTPTPRVPLTPDRIIDTALDITRQYGTAALSMRRLAAELGVEAMSLYHHVPNKKTLTTLMAGRSLSTLQPPDPATAWDQQLIQLLLGLYQAGVNNPTVIQALAAELPPPSAAGDTGAGAAVVAHVMRLLQHSPLPATQQPSAGYGLIRLLIGAIVTQLPAPTPPTAYTPITDPPATSMTHRWTAPAPTPLQNQALTDLQRSIHWFLLGITGRPPGIDVHHTPEAH